MLIVDQEGRIVLANNQAAQLFGYSDGQLEGQKVENSGSGVLPGEASGAPRRIFQRAAHAGDGWSWQERR